ncbi:MAG: hypothetical protein P8I51_01535 [Polaribacter sp.]|nr:hypothetical protein [Polaribacter sp.]MDG1953559.1 hypothetical protein [Polaribacter sp.]MDG2073964.1 hypothetical protein [Polaribacter sp.]
MRKILLFLVLTSSFFSCSTNEDSLPEENTVIGRWHLVGFEQTVMYEFTENLRYTILELKDKK